MMAAMWLARCDGAEAEMIRREIEGRDRDARLLRAADMRGFAALADMMAGVPAGVAVCAHEGEDIEEMVEHLARIGCAKTVLVFVDEPDAGVIARFFLAGATEVIAAGADPSGANGKNTCAEEGSAMVCPPAPEDGDGLAADVKDAKEGEDAGHTAMPRPDSKTDAAGRDAPAGHPDERDEAADPERSEVPLYELDAGARDLSAATDTEGGRKPSSPSQAAAAKPARTFGGPVRAAAREEGGAPLVVAISGRGGCGKSTLIAAMAWQAAHMGLRAAVIDLDLMFGNLHAIMGVERACDLAKLVDGDGAVACTQENVESTAMRIMPGLTLWGPCFAPEYAELLSAPSERLIGVLRHEADVIFADTSVFWGDAVAAAVSSCDRCLVVGTGEVGAEAATVRAAALAARIGVPKTRMTCVFNRFGAAGCDEERALRFEMAVALRSRLRIADGGQTVRDLLSFGKLGDLMTIAGPFSRDTQVASYGLLKELGCPLGAWEGTQHTQGTSSGQRPRIKLPWKHEEGSEQ